MEQGALMCVGTHRGRCPTSADPGAAALLVFGGSVAFVLSPPTPS